MLVVPVEVPDGTPAMVLRPVRILVADDEEAVRNLLRDVLGVNPRYEVLTARDGYETMLMARREHPDLVLLDIWMPGATGLEVCRELKKDERTSDVKIIMVTALEQESDKAIAKAAGADGYVTKPFRLAVLRDEIERVTAG